MRKCDNGVYRDMTAAEEEEFFRSVQERARQEAAQPPTQVDRIEAQMLYTAMMTDTLIEEG